MPLVDYRQVRPWAKAIREQVSTRRMPPWFADRHHGAFANDPSLTEAEIQTVRTWVDTGSPEGDPKSAPPPVRWSSEWNIGSPDLVVEMPRAFSVPASGDVDYQYVVIPLNLSNDRWVQAAEVRPGVRGVVHHAVLYIREPGSDWLRDVPSGIIWSPKGASTEQKRRIGHTVSDILTVYAPGTLAMKLPHGMGKRIAAGSDLVLQIHYTPNGRPAQDRTRVGLVFTKQTPSRQVLTLQMGTDQIAIPPGNPHYRRTVSGTLPNDALLLGFFPHLHLRGKSFEYRIVGSEGRYETLLKVAPYDFYWQMSYLLAEPRFLKAGTRLQVEANWDNSRNNRRNPDPDAEVHWGEQSWAEMMVGFFDVAVDSAVDKRQFFQRQP